METIGAALRNLRLEAGLTQDQLAERVGAAQTYISQVERNIRSPSWKLLLQYGRAVQMSVVEILRRAGLLDGIPEDLEKEIAVFVNDVPQFAELFDLVREYPWKLEEILRYGQWVTGKAELPEPGSSSRKKR